MGGRDLEMGMSKMRHARWVDIALRWVLCEENSTWALLKGACDHEMGMRTMVNATCLMGGRHPEMGMRKCDMPDEWTLL